VEDVLESDGEKLEIDTLEDVVVVEGDKELEGVTVDEPVELDSLDCWLEDWFEVWLEVWLED
jgi:hypothetical protein